MDGAALIVWARAAVIGLLLQYLVIRAAVMDAGRRLLDEQAVSVTMRELEAAARAERRHQTQGERRGRRSNFQWKKK